MDQRLFFLINRQWTGPVLDRIMAAASSLDLWLPVIVALVLLTAWLGRARARLFLLALGLTLAVGDGLIDNPLKHTLHRPRPFQAMAGVRQVDLARRPWPRFLALFQPLSTSVTSGPLAIRADDPFPGRSFPSSHAVNNFGAATVLAFFYRRRGALYFPVAALVAYSRVYVGAHWPSDVAVSAVLGVGIALCVLAAMQWAAQRRQKAEGRNW
jgi:undecaprenyl-diphosphatase